MLGEVLTTPARAAFPGAVVRRPLLLPVTDIKKQTLLAAFDAAGGNAAAACTLGLHPSSFRRLMRQLGLREGGG